MTSPGRQLLHGRDRTAFSTRYEKRVLRRFAIQRLVLPVVATLAAFAFVGCPGELENPERFGPATCPAPIDVPTEIFVPSCTDVLCHGSVEPAAGLDLLSDNVLERL